MGRSRHFHDFTGHRAQYTPTRRLKVSLVKDQQARRYTSLWTVPSIGSLNRRATRLQSGAVYWVTGSPCEETDRLMEASTAHPRPTKCLAIPIETSSSYTPRGSTAGIVQSTQGLTSKVHTCLVFGKFCSVLIISYSLPDCKRSLEWFSIIPSSSYTNRNILVFILLCLQVVTR